MAGSRDVAVEEDNKDFAYHVKSVLITVSAFGILFDIS